MYIFPKVLQDLHVSLVQKHSGQWRSNKYWAEIAALLRFTSLEVALDLQHPVLEWHPVLRNITVTSLFLHLLLFLLPQSLQLIGNFPSSLLNDILYRHCNYLLYSHLIGGM